MVKVKGITPQEEFDEVMKRAYANIGAQKIESAKTKEELKYILISEYFHERAVDSLLEGIIQSLKRKKIWKEKEVEKVEAPPFVPEKPVERIRVKLIPKKWTAEDIERYLREKEKEEEGRRYVITRKGKRIEAEKYRALISRLAKAWKAPKKERVRWSPRRIRKYITKLKTERVGRKEYVFTKTGKRMEKKEYMKRIKSLASAWNKLHRKKQSRGMDRRG